MAEYDVLRQQILDRFEQIIPLAEARRRVAVTVDRLVGARERLATGRLTVVVCGEFKRGKSRLLNALLGEPNLSPVDAFIATRLVTTVERGDRERVHVSLEAAGGRPAERRRIRRDQISEYARQGSVHPDVERASLLEITLPDPRLTPGLVLVDTPGVGGMFHDHTSTTKKYLPSADAVLFVASAEEPLSRYEVDFLAEATHAVRTADNPDALLVVLTKIDLVPDVDVFLAGVRARVAEVTGRDPEQTEILPVSSKAKEIGLATGNAALIEQSGFPELERALWAQLARHRAKVLLGGALTEIDAAARVLLEPLEVEAAALRDTSQKKISDLTEQASREAARLADLAASAAPWRDSLAGELRRLRQELQRRTEREFDRIWDRAESEYLTQREYLVQPDHLGERVNSDLGMALSSVGEWGSRQAAVVQRELATRIGMELAGSAFGQLPPPGVLDLGGFGRLHRPVRQITHHEPARYETVRETRQVERGGFVKAAGSVLGSLFGAGAKKWLGEVVDYFSPPRYETIERPVLISGERTWVEQVEEEISPQVLAERREQLRAALRQGRASQSGQLSRTLDETVDAFSADISAELDSRIERERERIDDTLPRLRDAARATAEQAQARLAELATEQRPLVELRAAGQLLTDRVTRLSNRRGDDPPEPGADRCGRGDSGDPAAGRCGPGDESGDPSGPQPGPVR